MRPLNIKLMRPPSGEPKYRERRRERQASRDRHAVERRSVIAAAKPGEMTRNYGTQETAERLDQRQGSENFPDVAQPKTLDGEQQYQNQRPAVTQPERHQKDVYR